jgi:methylenetetrahydrofolate reductase (NADPH)
MQPTIFDKSTFAVWSKEAFKLWVDVWASIYDDESPSAEFIYNIYETYYLVAVVDNDYVSPTIFSLFGIEDEKDSIDR